MWTTVLAAALKLIALYKEARDRQQALNPRTGVDDDPVTPEREDFKSDTELATLLGSDSRSLISHADELLVKYRG